MGSRALAPALVLLAFGCSPEIGVSLLTPTDYTQVGETEIENAMAVQFGVGVEAQCDEPASTEPGTTFDCTGITPSSAVIEFVATITKDDHVTVALGEIP